MYSSSHCTAPPPVCANPLLLRSFWLLAQAAFKLADVSDEKLREMAQHRGLKLVKSRRRKPGTGDFGKYGLTDASGKALLGISDDGLTADAGDIQDYLRTSEQRTWKQSADTTPDRPAPSERPRSPPPEQNDEPIRRRKKRASDGGSESREREPSSASPPRVKAQAKPVFKLVPKVAPELQADTKPETEPRLQVRMASAQDAGALAKLLNQISGVSLKGADVADNLVSAIEARAGMVVAELGDIVGCCGWAAVATVQRGKIGRVTVLIVDKKYRRQGIATAMLATTEAALAKAGCRQIEAMSDIAVNNSHNFFRSLEFEQVSYRFVRDLNKSASGERVRNPED